MVFSLICHNYFVLLLTLVFSSVSPYLTLTAVQIKFIFVEMSIWTWWWVNDWQGASIFVSRLWHVICWKSYSAECCTHLKAGSEECARFSKGCCLMPSGTISDILMLMNKAALSALEIMLFKVRRGCFMNSVLRCCNPVVAVQFCSR